MNKVLSLIMALGMLLAPVCASQSFAARSYGQSLRGKMASNGIEMIRARYFSAHGNFGVLVYNPVVGAYAPLREGVFTADDFMIEGTEKVCEMLIRLTLDPRFKGSAVNFDVVATSFEPSIKSFTVFKNTPYSNGEHIFRIDLEEVPYSQALERIVGAIEQKLSFVSDDD